MNERFGLLFVKANATTKLERKWLVDYNDVMQMVQLVTGKESSGLSAVTQQMKNESASRSGLEDCRYNCYG